MMGSMLLFEDGCRNTPGGLQAMVIMCDEKYVATYFTFVFCKLIKIGSGINAKYGKRGVCVCVFCSSTAGRLEQHL